MTARTWRSRARSVLLLALVAALAPLGGGAHADTGGESGRAAGRARVTLTAKLDGVLLQGTARSTRRSCLADRQVRIIHQVGNRGGGDDELFHAQLIVMTGRRSGTWNVGFVLPPAKYYGVLPRDAQCRRAASATVQVPPTKQLERRGRTPVTVTITAQGTDLSGVVRSSRVSCVQDRKVVVFRQHGARGGGDDERFASDVSFWTSGTTATWSTGNTGTEGRFYARVGRTSSCRADESPTVTARR